MCTWKRMPQSGSEPMHIFDPMSYIIEGDTALAVVFGL